MEQHDVQTHAQTHEHPQPGEYIRIAVILATITAIEVAVVYVEALAPVLIAILLVLSALKFALVVLWFMHLKFDSRLFSGIFVGGLILGAGLLIALLVLMQQQAVVQ